MCTHSLKVSTFTSALLKPLLTRPVGQASAFKHLRRAIRGRLLAQGGVAALQSVGAARESLATFQDHTMKTGDLNYSEASSAASLLQQQAHEASQAWFLKAAQCEVQLDGTLGVVSKELEAFANAINRSRGH
jgi:ethanolamine utilization protein EutQ (cupin superfamily)